VPTPTPVPAFSTAPRARDLLQGFSLPFTALGLVFRSRRLLGLTALSSFVTAASLIGLLVGVFRWAPKLTNWMWSRPNDVLIVFWTALLVVVFLLMLVVGASTVPVLLLAPLQDPISEATEALCGGFDPPPFRAAELVRQTVAAVAHTLARIFWLLLGHAALLALNLIPAVGQLAWSVSAPLWTMAWVAAEYLDGPMTRHGYPFSAVRRVVWGRLGLCMGFGAAVYLILWVPILNFFFIPIAVIGGTLLYRGLRASGALADPPPGR